MSDTTKKSIVINKSFLSGTDNSNGSNSNNKKSKKNTRNLSEELIKPNKLKKMLLDKINAKRKAEQGSYTGGGGATGATSARDNIENRESKIDISKETKIFSSEFKKSLDFLDNYIGQKRNERIKTKTLKRQNTGPSTSLNNDILKYVNSNNKPQTSNVISSTNNSVTSIQTPAVIQANNLSPRINQNAAPVSTPSPHSPPLFQKIQLNLPSKPLQTTPSNLSVGSGPKINLSLGKMGNENTMIYTELPPELQNFTPPVYNIHSPSMPSSMPSLSPLTSIDVSPSMGEDAFITIDKTGGATGAGEIDKIVELINNENSSKTSLSLSTPTFSPVKLSDDAPYGCLKNGKKPTFRMYNKTIKNNHHHNHDHDHDHDRDPENNVYSNRQSKLRDLQNKHNKRKYPGLKTNDDNVCVEDTESESDKDTNNEEKKEDVKRTKIRRHLRKTITKKFKLGKQPGSNIVGVLIKNNDTRKNIQKECGLLKSKQLSEVKKYLVEKNLIKIGSTAPPGVIRNIYEASMLAGEVDNIGKGVILHNFLEDKKMW
jgi:hypothetical protein